LISYVVHCFKIDNTNLAAEPTRVKRLKAKGGFGLGKDLDFAGKKAAVEKRQPITGCL